MEKLPDILNCIHMHNGQMINDEHGDAIDIQDDSLTIHQSCTLQMIYTSDMMINNEVTIHVDKGIAVDLIEMFQFETATHFTRHLHVDQASQVTRYVENNCQDHHEVEFHDHITLQNDATVNCAYVELNDNSIQSYFHYDLLQPGARALVRLASMARTKDKKYYEVKMNHLAPNTYGDMDNYGIVQSQGSLIIDGVGAIAKGMSQSESHQTNKILVFDAGCVAKANPYLYIDEYDVKASHGASVGQIDEDHLYYLQSRGLSLHDAMHLVTYGYFLPVLDFIHVESLKEKFSEVLKEKVGL